MWQDVKMENNFYAVLGLYGGQSCLSELVYSY